MTRRLIPRANVHDVPGYEWAGERWLIRQNSERRLPFHKISGFVLIDLDDLDAAVERGRVEPVSAFNLRKVGSAHRRAS